MRKYFLTFCQRAFFRGLTNSCALWGFSLDSLVFFELLGLISFGVKPRPRCALAFGSGQLTGQTVPQFICALRRKHDFVFWHELFYKIRGWRASSVYVFGNCGTVCYIKNFTLTIIQHQLQIQSH